MDFKGECMCAGCFMRSANIEEKEDEKLAAAECDVGGTEPCRGLMARTG